MVRCCSATPTQKDVAGKPEAPVAGCNGGFCQDCSAIAVECGKLGLGGTDRRSEPRVLGGSKGLFGLTGGGSLLRGLDVGVVAHGVFLSVGC